jgi:hypothetical protein
MKRCSQHPSAIIRQIPRPRQEYRLSGTKLVIVEGIPGSGKTSTAHFVSNWLKQNGLHTLLHLEGDLDHPADYESVAYLNPGEFSLLLQQYPDKRMEMLRLALVRGQEIFLSYRKLHNPPAGLFTALSHHDIYELPLPDWQRLTLERWEAFARLAIDQDCTYVFECCFLQNLLTTPLARFDQPEDEAAAHVLQVARVLKPLKPVLIYLDPPSVRITMERIACERPREWLNFVIAYIAGQTWGKARGLVGFDGMVRFYETRRDLEKTLFPALQAQRFSNLWLEDAGQNWNIDHQRIRSFLHDGFSLA